MPETVNTAELKDYVGVLSDDVMSEVDKAIAIQFDIGIEKNLLGVSAAMDEITKTIESIVKKKIESIQLAADVDVEDAVIRIGEGIERLFGDMDKKQYIKPQETSKTVEKSDGNNIEDSTMNIFENTLQDKKTKSIEQKKTQEKWSKEKIYEFLKDAEELPHSEMMKKWDLKDKVSIYKKKYYLKNKLKNYYGVSLD